MAYTTIDDPSAYFQTALYTGTGATQSVSNDGNSDLQPDWVWIKKRSALGNNSVFDSTRGAYKELVTNGANAEATDVQLLTQFDTDGFTVGTNSGVNGSGDTFVAWQWKANGGTTSSNTDGFTTSTVQANTDAGFSIVTYTTDGSERTIGHGLGVKPDIIITKPRNAATSWVVTTDIIDGSMDFLVLDSSAAAGTFTRAAPTSSVFSYLDDSGNNMVSYCFASKQGFSKFGKYTGNAGGENGPFVHLGFKPAFVMIKLASSTQSWDIHDTARNLFNPMEKRLLPNSSGAEETRPTSGGSVDCVDFLSNGFKVRSVESILNSNNGTYIYMAFAENPFVTSTGIPTTAR